jgi:endonuclease YncB( thermonuclease family)
LPWRRRFEQLSRPIIHSLSWGERMEQQHRMFRYSATLAIGLCVSAHAATLEGRVNWVIDGDTFDMQINGKTTRIRICGINSPERGERGYEKAKNYLHDRILNRIVRCIPIGEGTVCDGRSKRMSQNRLVAQCFVDKQDIALPMIESGNACDWPHFSGGHYQKTTSKSVCIEKRVY